MPRLRLLIAVVLLAALVACRRDVPQLDEVQRVAYSVKPAVVRISAYATADFRYTAAQLRSLETALRVRAGAAGDTVVDTGAGGSGSGFIIHPDGVIITSGHVVAPTRDTKALERDLRRNGAIAVLVRHFPVETLREIHRNEELERYVAPLASAGTLEEMRVVNQVELSNGEALPFRIRTYSPALHERGTDLAILQIERKGLPSIPLGDSDATHVGESIWSVGYPAVASSSDEVIGGWLSRDSDLEATLNPGTITAIKRNVANTPVFQSNVAIYRGNSGGPAVNRKGEVIGISTWGHTNAEQIKFLVPVNVARQLLGQAKIAVSTGGEFNTSYRAALAAARRREVDRGEEAVGPGDRALSEVSRPDALQQRRGPGHPLASPLAPPSGRGRGGRWRGDPAAGRRGDVCVAQVPAAAPACRRHGTWGKLRRADGDRADGRRQSARLDAGAIHDPQRQPRRREARPRRLRDPDRPGGDDL
jgi:serine protease Do